MSVELKGATLGRMTRGQGECSACIVPTGQRLPTKDCQRGAGGRRQLAEPTGRANPSSDDWRLSHQRLKALTTSHPRVAIHTRVASKAITSMAMQIHPVRRSGAGVLVEFAESTTSGRST